MRRIRQALSRMGGKSSKPSSQTVPEKSQRVQQLRDGLGPHQQHLNGGMNGTANGSTAMLSRSATTTRRSLAMDLEPDGPGVMIMHDGSREGGRGLSTANTNTTGNSMASSGSGENKDKGIDIVLVHGFGGGRTRSWTQDGVCWPRDLLPRELPANTRVISWGWRVPENVAVVGEAGGYGQLCDMVSDQLSMDLARVDGEAERDLIFIAHGIGGLIVKDALSTTAVSQVFGKRSELGSIYPRTVGVIFLGTPQKGHGRQTLAQCAAIAARLDSAGGAGGAGGGHMDDAFFRIMADSNDALETHRGEFALISRDLPVVCVREQLTTAVRGVDMLPKNCASYEGLNVTTDDIFRDHNGLAKYSDRQDPGYFQLVGHISKLTRRTRFQDTEAGMIRSKEILDALHYDMRENENKANEELKQTSAWILSAKDTQGSGAGDNVPNAFNNWLEDPNQSIFWISGNPGSGKTTLMRHAFHDPSTREKLQRWASSAIEGETNVRRRDKPELLMAAVFLFEAGSYVQKSREGILRGMLYQILTQKPEFIPVCFPSFMQGPWPPRVPFNTTVNLSQAFYQLFARMSKTLRLCMFIDGLDEYRLAEGAQDQQDDPNNQQPQQHQQNGKKVHKRSSRYSVDELANDTSTLAVSEYGSVSEQATSVDERGDVLGNAAWIADSHSEIARLIMDLSNQDHVKLCVASRELPPFEEAFAGVPRLRVHTQTEKLISQYCADRLDKVAPGLSQGQRPLCDEVARKSRGDILWARLAIDMLMEGSLRKLMATLESLPSQLGGPNGLYMRIIQALDRDEQREAARIFHLILRAVDPPNLIMLAFADEGFMAGPELQAKDPGVGRLIVDHDRAHPYTRADMAAITSRMQSRLTTSCADLLETTDKGNRVVFMHLTAKEFVLRSSVWKKVKAPVPSSVDLDVSLMSGTIRYLKCFSTLRLVVTNRPRLQFTPEAWLLVSHVLRYAARVDERLVAAGDPDCSRETYVALLDELDRTFQEAWQTAVKEHVPARDDVGWYRDRYRPLMASHWSDYEPMELGPSPRRAGFLSLALQANLLGYVSYKLSLVADDKARASLAMDLLEYAVSPEGDSRTVDGGPSVSASGAVTGTYRDFHHDMPDGRFVPLLLEAAGGPPSAEGADAAAAAAAAEGGDGEGQDGSGGGGGGDDAVSTAPTEVVESADLEAQRRLVWTQALKAGRQFFHHRGSSSVLNMTPESTTTLARNRGRWVAAIKALLSTGWADPHIQIPAFGIGGGMDDAGMGVGGELKTAAEVIKDTLEGEVEFQRELIMIEALIVKVSQAQSHRTPGRAL
ncbi:uncharacterized protein PpBr36_10715 [Pyricularia pennisetigena]|uniref:uncharacterized protein n=1 Tax=Pyricularia pennisetigena TaxID=1578925 RepID=UPI00115485AA|nr:uncharacterized protein PpBr36_10715 [Pyricularia pennisetigena]TLS20914.1 hypothetical protein PpBr36_10715 [Pyricularia pennisetigena]